MRMRWMAGLVGVSALVLATAASVAQRPSGPVGNHSADGKRWRSSDDTPRKVELDPSGERPAALPAPGDARDPMEAFESFLRRNRQEADDSIRTLTEEAEALRARLAKVEAALGRWQAVAGAFQVETREAAATPEPTVSTSPVSLPEPTPANLEHPPSLPVESSPPAGTAPPPVEAPQPKS